MLVKDKNVQSDYNEATQHEWLETNGLGGFAARFFISFAIV
jgi:hypothetical protein